MKGRRHESLSEVLPGNYLVSETGCWNWTKGKMPFGYGVVTFQQKQIRTHRLSWMIHRGKIPAGMCVCHRCDNPSCINPDHLFLGTFGDNNRDMKAKGRMKHNHAGKRFCKRGHEFTEENTRVYQGRRYCRECKRILWRLAHPSNLPGLARRQGD